MRYQLNLKQMYNDTNSILLIANKCDGLRYRVYKELSGNILQLINNYNNIEVLIHFTWQEIGLKTPMKSKYKITIENFIKKIKLSHKQFFGNTDILECSTCGIKFLRERNEKYKKQYCSKKCLDNRAKSGQI